MGFFGRLTVLDGLFWVHFISFSFREEIYCFCFKGLGTDFDV